MDLDVQANASSQNQAREHADVATPGKSTRALPGGSDPLGQKENKVAPYFNDMIDVVKALAPQFAAVGLTFRPENVLATVLQEADAANPVGDVSYDGGMGLMQITPSNGQLDAPVAKVLGWNNSESVAYNLEHSKWKNAQANLMAGGQTLLLKAGYIKAGVPTVWSAMTQQQRWRATMFAYNAGQVAAITALQHGGPNAPMVSTYTYEGQTHSHNYTAELDQKLSYVDAHDPFASGASTTPTTAPATGGAPISTTPSAAPAGPKTFKPAPTIAQVLANQAVIKLGMQGPAVSYVQQHVGATPVDGQFGLETQTKVKAYQQTHHLTVDGVVGQATLTAMEGTTPATGTGAPVAGAGGTTAPAGPLPPAGSAIAIASRFLNLPSWSPKLTEGIRGPGWSYEPVGGQTNNCAEFVTSCLRMAGEIGYQQDNVGALEQSLGATWKYRASVAAARPGDVWICNNSVIQHTVLVSAAGATETIGSDGSGTEIIKREPMPTTGDYAGAVALGPA